MRKFIYSPSFPSTRLVFYFLNCGYKVTVITVNPSVRDLCMQMNLDYIWCGLYDLPPLRRKSIWNPFAWIKYYKRLNKVVSETSDQICDGDELYITVLGFDLKGLHFIQKLATLRRKVKLFYWPENYITPDRYNYYPRVLNDWLKLLKVNILYSPLFIWKKETTGKYIFAASGYLKRNKIRYWEGCEVWKTDVYENLTIPNMQDSKVAVIVGGYSLQADEEIFGHGKLQELYKMIHLTVPDCKYKPHPGQYIIDPFMKQFELFKHINFPIELFHRHVALVFFVVSTGVAYLAEKNVCCVSLLELLDCGEEVKNEWREIMERSSKSKIIFPKTKLELQKILNEHARC